MMTTGPEMQDAGEVGQTEGPGQEGPAVTPGIRHPRIPGRKAVLRVAAGSLLQVLDGRLPSVPWADNLMCRLRIWRSTGRLPHPVPADDDSFNDFIYQRMAGDRWTPLERCCIDKQYAKLVAAALCPGVRTSWTRAVFSLSRPGAAERVIAQLRARAGKPEVAKPTHGSGSVLFLRHAPQEQEIRSFCEGAARSYYARTRESQYKGLERKIILEDDLSDGGRALTDYKFYCSYGEVIFCQIDTDRFTDHRRCLVTPRFEILKVRLSHDLPDMLPEQPRSFSDMLRIAGRLSRPFCFVRIDLYTVRDDVYFGEFTFAPEGGTGTLSSDEFGRWVMGRIRARQIEEEGK